MHADMKRIVVKNVGVDYNEGMYRLLEKEDRLKAKHGIKSKEHLQVRLTGSKLVCSCLVKR